MLTSRALLRVGVDGGVCTHRKPFKVHVLHMAIPGRSVYIDLDWTYAFGLCFASRLWCLSREARQAPRYHAVACWICTLD